VECHAWGDEKLFNFVVALLLGGAQLSSSC